jgi:hypothetical protein
MTLPVLTQAQPLQTAVDDLLGGWVRAFNEKSLPALEELLAPDFTRTYRGTPMPPVSRDEFLEATSLMFTHQKLISLSCSISSDYSISGSLDLCRVTGFDLRLVMMMNLEGIDMGAISKDELGNGAITLNFLDSEMFLVKQSDGSLKVSQLFVTP